VTQDRPAFGFSVTPGSPIGVGQEMAEAEALGYYRLGIWDSPALFREPWVTLASVARDTSRIRLGTWVTNPVSRHPLVTASAAATLEDLAPGRTYLGIGAGGTGVWHLGAKEATLDTVRAYVAAVRGLLADGRATYAGAPARMEWGRGTRVPIIVSAHGPKSLRLAGEIADGVVVGLGVTPEVVRGSLAYIAEGAESAGRSIGDIEVWFTCFWFVDVAPGAAMAEGGWAATAFALHFARGRTEGKFVPEEYQEGITTLGADYDLVAHGRVDDDLKRRYVDRANELGIGDYIRRRFMFCGTPAEAEAQIREAMAAGARNFDGAIDADLAEHRIRITKWANLVLPRFGLKAASADLVP
jgi:5,10-methylenetetrahydromethanopterin reductase